MEIRPVPLDQVALGRDGREYLITGEAGRIAQQLAEIDPTFKVFYNEAGEFFTVTQAVPRRDDPLQTRDIPVRRVPLGEWDGRIVRELEMRVHELRHGKSVADRLDALDDKRKADSEYAFEQAVGEAAGPLLRAFQRDFLTSKPRVFIPERKPKAAAVAA